MSQLAWLLFFYALILVVFIYVWLCADPDSSSLHGTISRIFVQHIPSLFTRIFRTICGERVSGYCCTTYDYVVHQRNPILIILYLAIINGAFISWLLYGVPLLPPLNPLSDLHYYLAYAGVIVSQFTFYLACTKPPGCITMDTINCFNHTEYDGLMYLSKMYCTTCKIPKIARSKHCRMCGYCVPIFDHHCVWVNQCVGELNYRYFLLFLFTNSMFFFYATAVLSWLLLHQIISNRLFSLVFIDRQTRREYSATIWIVGQYVLVRYTTVIVLLMLALIMGMAVFAFFGYHIYLIYNGLTTNESAKLDYFHRMYCQIKKQFDAYLKMKENHELPHSQVTLKGNEPAELKEAAGSKETSTVNEPKSSASSEDVNNNTAISAAKSKLPPGFLFNEPSNYRQHQIHIILDRLDEIAEQGKVKTNPPSSYLPERELLELFSDKHSIANLYNSGFLQNIRRILSPPSLKQAKKRHKKKA